MSRTTAAVLGGLGAGAVFLLGEAFPEHFGAILVVGAVLTVLAAGAQLWARTKPTPPPHRADRDI
jgi:hypothetical protein